MNRTIKFRGLRTDGKGWAVGSLLSPHAGNESTYIIGWNGSDFEVRPSSVGMFTGLTDKNGVEVFEGDRVEISMLEMVIGYSETYAGFTINRIETGQIFVYNINAKVIAVRGNIHEQ
jgi:hypothetical protein